MLQIFDDGSSLGTMADGSTFGFNTDGVAVSKVDAAGNYFQSPGYWTDARESAKLDPYVAAPSSDTRPWWERVAEYGISRAIDNHFGPTQANKTSAPATFAGQNGQTYSQVGSPLQQGGGLGGMGALLPLLAIGGLAFLALR